LNTIILTVGSVTYAIKVRKLLEHAGVKCKVVKINSENTQNGCSYGIKIDERMFYQAVAILRANSIDYAVYNSK
jgi:hypothetical protein